MSEVILESTYSIFGWEDIKTVLEEFAAEYGCAFKVWNPHSKPSKPGNPEEENTVFIRFWSVPYET
mgnify:FL=1